MLGKQIGGLSPKVARDYAERTAIGSTRGVMSTRKMGGSLEGLMRQKTTMIESSGSGYSNTAQMAKRYNKQSLRVNPARYDTIGSGGNFSHSSNSTFKGTKHSSVQRLFG